MPTVEVQTITNGKKGKQVKTVRTSSNPARKQRRKKQPRAPAMASAMSVVAHNHYRMLRDPCHATLGESAYPGRAGLTSRFTGITTYSGGTDTAFYASYAMSALAQASGTAASSATSFIPVYGIGLPGQSYMIANADSYRVIGACISMEYTGTELNRSGIIYGGVLPASTIPAGVATSIDALKVLLSSETRTPDTRTLEINWFPGTNDSEYVKTTDAVYTDSHNNVTIAMESMPAGVQMKVRVTVIIEWLPKISLGMSMPSPVAGTNPPAFYEALHTKASQDASFSDAFGTGAADRGRQYAYYAGQRMVDATAGVAMSMLARGGRRAIRN